MGPHVVRFKRPMDVFSRMFLSHTSNRRIFSLRTDSRHRRIFSLRSDSMFVVDETREWKRDTGDMNSDSDYYFLLKLLIKTSCIGVPCRHDDDLCARAITQRLVLPERSTSAERLCDRGIVVPRVSNSGLEPPRSMDS